MNLTERQPFAPGEILKEEFLEPLGLTQGELADMIDVARRRINEIIRGKREITPDTALRLEKAFGVSAEFWLNLQMKHDLWRAQQHKKKEYQRIKPVRNVKKLSIG